MSLLQCHECGREVSSQAKRCPACGAPVRRPGYGGIQVPRWLGWSVVLAGVLILAWIVANGDYSEDKVKRPIGSTATAASVSPGAMMTISQGQVGAEYLAVYDRYLELQRANDQTCIDELRRVDVISDLDAGTRVLVIGLHGDGNIVEVRVQDGPHSGKAVYLPVYALRHVD